jgi:hypothetical protein
MRNFGNRVIQLCQRRWEKFSFSLKRAEWHSPHNLVNSLEGGRCIAKDKWHHQELVMVFMSAKINFGDACLLHVNLVIV